MELRNMRTFCAVVEQSSFSKAAEAVNLSQPTVSLQIKSLEDELKLDLIDRLDRKVLPTACGKILYKYTKEILSKIEDFKDEVNRSCREGVCGRVSIAAGVTVGEGIMPNLLGSFSKKYSTITVSLLILDTSEIIRRMIDYELDVGIVGAEIKHKDLILEKFTQDSLILIVYPQHPWAKKKSIALPELLKEPMLIREKGSGTRIKFASELRKGGYKEENLNIAMELGSAGAIKQGVMNKQGVSIVNQQSVKDLLDLGRLVKVPIKDFDLKKDFYLVLHSKKLKSPPLKIFLQFLKEHNPHLSKALV